MPGTSAAAFSGASVAADFFYGFFRMSAHFAPLTSWSLLPPATSVAYEPARLGGGFVLIVGETFSLLEVAVASPEALASQPLHFVRRPLLDFMRRPT